MNRALLLILIVLLLVSCSVNWVRVDGVYTETLMNKKIVYYAKVNGGDREISELIYNDLVDKLSDLPDDKVLVCEMGKFPGSNVYDQSCCLEEDKQ